MNCGALIGAVLLAICAPTFATSITPPLPDPPGAEIQASEYVIVGTARRLVYLRWEKDTLVRVADPPTDTSAGVVVLEVDVEKVLCAISPALPASVRVEHPHDSKSVEYVREIFIDKPMVYFLRRGVVPGHDGNYASDKVFYAFPWARNIISPLPLPYARDIIQLTPRLCRTT